MADRPFRAGSNLDASGPREVVYCHQCDSEWYNDEHGLICPLCEGEITEIITPESDPRPGHEAPAVPPEFRPLPNRNIWPESDTSDPEEADIEEHITHGPGGSVFISQTIRSAGPRTAFGTARRRNPVGQNDPNDVMRDFQNMLGTLMGPGFRPGPPGRSGHEELFPQPMGFHLAGNGIGVGPGPGVIGGRFTYSTGRLNRRNIDEPQAPPDLATLIGNIFGTIGAPGQPGEPDARGGMPPGLQGLFASLLNPINARQGDAVYSQEALDQIISTLMEQHPTSNAPGPASPDAIAALPKRKLDEKLLGPEGKGECSVCMDDVHIGDEVVMLPCSHWFHEACASAWLGEHNTCPICRKGIDGDAPQSSNGRSSHTSQSPTSRHEHRQRRLSLGSRLSRENTPSRNEARLDSIRNSGRLTPTEESGPRRWQVVGDDHSRPDMDYTRQIPGSFQSYRQRDPEMSDSQRDSRRNASGADRSRDSRRSSQSGGAGNNGGNGPMSWLRDRFSGPNNDRRRD